MKLPTRGEIIRSVLVGALLSLPFIVVVIAQPVPAGNASGIFTILKDAVTPATAEAVRMTCDPDLGTCGNPCSGATDQCTTDAGCAGRNAFPYCAIGAGRCGTNICKCAPQTAGKTCGSDGCGGTIGMCANGQTCSAAGNCIPQSPYCPRTDNPITDTAITFVPSADVGGNNSIKITSNSIYCPIGSVSQTPCSAHNNDQATCASEGCSYAPLIPGQCTPTADQVDCTQFGTQTDCRTSPLGKGQCAWLPDGTGTGFPFTPAASVGLALRAGPGTTYSCQTKTSYCSSPNQTTCLSDPTCAWMPPIPASCYGTPAFKTSSVVTIGQFSSKIYEKKIWQVPMWDYSSCSFWRCTTKTGFDPHYLDDTCTVGQACNWADGCLVRACVLSTSAQVTASYGAAPKGWTLSTGSTGGSFDPTLLNTCWGTNPNGQFIPAPGCRVRTDGGWSPFGACINGTQTRTCTNPPPDGGADCVGPATQSCPIDGICNNAVVNTCTSGTMVDIADSASQYLWNCNGINGGLSQSCGKFIPVNATCGATFNSCTAGAASGGYDAGDRYIWNCLGSYGGSDANGCVQMKSETGICSSLHYGCVTPTASINNSDNFTTWTWTCPGRFGGGNTSCVENKVPVVGACGPAPSNQKHYQCASGNAVNMFFDGFYSYSWNCNGANGGASASCAENLTPPPVNGSCGFNPINPIHNVCNSGISIGAYDAGDAWKWNCAGTFGGVNQSCTEMKSVNGSCAAAHYGCVPGTGASIANVDGASQWTWTCSGLYGGLPQNCAELKPPTVTWTPSSATIDYHSKISYAYSTTNAASCDYDELDGSGNVVRNIWMGGPTASPWSGPQGPYDTNVNRRLTCWNASGKSAVAELHIVVRQNNAACIGVTPDNIYLTPGEHFNATAKMTNTGANGWTVGASNYVLSRNDTLWGSDTMRLINPIVGQNGQGQFSENLIAPSVEGDYDFTWQMRPIFSGTWWPTFGQPCGATTPLGNNIRVKAATLALTPQNYQFSDTVIGDSPSTVKVHFQNLGGGTITGIKLNNLIAPFSCVANCNLVLGPGASGDVTLAFNPTATGTAAQNVPISNTNNSPTVPIVDIVSGLPVDHIYIYGKGTDKFTVSTDEAGMNTVSTVNFGDVPWTTAKYISLTVTNRSKEHGGNVNPNVSIPAAYSCESGCTAATLNPGKSKTVRVKFYPNLKTEHVYSGVFNVGSIPDVHVDMTGKGVLPQFQTEEK